jgi:predicted AAA+ superfamily ATPase
MENFKRILKLSLPKHKSAFLWGPRKVGKSYWIREHFPEAIIIDLLKTNIYSEYAAKPALLRERYQEASKLIVIDEVQMVPAILNEVHWMIENCGASFLLTGSSPRKLRRSHANLLGGRAWRYTMAPLCYPEIKIFNYDIEKILTCGLLPSHILSTDPVQDLRAYVADYLKEEIAAQAVVQNIPAFSEFLRVAALNCGELINYTSMGRDTGVSSKVVRNYFQILEDTLLGYRLKPWKKTPDRRLIETEKFYLFDVGVTNYLSRRTPKIGTSEFGKSFEHYILMELTAYQSYKNPEMDLHYWRTSTGLEVDFILGDMEVAIEIKAAKRVDSIHAKGLRALAQSHKVRRKILVSFEEEAKKLADNIECLFWQDFLAQLWNGDLIS